MKGQLVETTQIIAQARHVYGQIEIHEGKITAYHI